MPARAPVIALVALAAVLIPAPAQAEATYDLDCWDSSGTQVLPATLGCTFPVSFTKTCPAGFCALYERTCEIRGTGLLGCTIELSGAGASSCGPIPGGCRANTLVAVFGPGPRSVSGTVTCTGTTTATLGALVGCSIERV